MPVLFAHRTRRQTRRWVGPQYSPRASQFCLRVAAGRLADAEVADFGFEFVRGLGGDAARASELVGELLEFGAADRQAGELEVPSLLGPPERCHSAVLLLCGSP